MKFPEGYIWPQFSNAPFLCRINNPAELSSAILIEYGVASVIEKGPDFLRQRCLHHEPSAPRFCVGFLFVQHETCFWPSRGWIHKLPIKNLFMDLMTVPDKS